MTRIDHVVLTRFNLPTEGVEGLIRARDGWLHDRIALFERYCAPSIARQTQPLSWIVYLDPESPGWLLERLQPFVDQGLFRTVKRSTVSQEELLTDIADTVGSPGDVLITTNLDNDDGLPIDFSERVKAVRANHPRMVIYLNRGLIRRDHDLYLRVDRRNAFCSVREPWQGAVTAWSEYHNEFPRVMPAVGANGAPGWLQVVHGANVSNRVRGRLVSPREYSARFGDLLDGVRSPRAVELARDAFLALPLRSARDGARSAVRIVGLRTLGKDRYQQTKARLAELVRTARSRGA